MPDLDKKDEEQSSDLLDLLRESGQAAAPQIPLPYEELDVPEIDRTAALLGPESEDAPVSQVVPSPEMGPGMLDTQEGQAFPSPSLPTSGGEGPQEGSLLDRALAQTAQNPDAVRQFEIDQAAERVTPAEAVDNGLTSNNSEQAAEKDEDADAGKGDNAGTTGGDNIKAAERAIASQESKPVNVLDYLRQKYGFSAPNQKDETQTLNDAQAAVRQKLGDIDKQQAYNLILSGLSLGNAKPQTEMFDQQRKLAQLPVQQFEQRQALRQQQLKDVANVNALANELQSLDPNSPRAKALQGIAAQTLSKWAPGVDWSKVSPADMKLALQPAEIGARLQGAEDQKKLLAAVAGEKNREAKETKLQTAIDQKARTLEANPAYSKLRQSIEFADRVRGVVENAKTNPVAANQLGQELSMVASNSGRMSTELAKESSKLSKKIADQIRLKAKQGLEGTIPSDLANEALQFIDSITKPSQVNLKKLQVLAARQIAENHGISPEDAMKRLGYAEQAPAAPVAPAQEEEVPVVSPEGKRGRVPKSKLGAALKKGFKQVQ